MNIKKILFRTVSFFFVFAILFSLICEPCIANASSLPSIEYATDACLYSLNAEKLIFKHNTSDSLFPASSVKLMTGLIACELLSDRLEEKIEITDSLIEGASDASMGLLPGMTVTIEDLLLGLLCAGGNDAALALSRICAPSTAEFVTLMNAYCSGWEMYSTKFTNPTGLDDAEMHTTLSDMLILAKRACKNELYLSLSSKASFTYSPYGDEREVTRQNRNMLINTSSTSGYKNPYVSGLMVGNTDLGGYSAIVYAERGSDSYICIVTGAQKKDDIIYSYKYANDLINYATGTLTYKKVLDSDKPVCSINVDLASPENGKDFATVACVTSDEIYALIPRNADIDKDVKLKYYLHYETLNAPVSENMVVGGVDLIYDGKVIGSSKLVTTRSVEANSLLLLLHNARAFISGRTFILCVIFVALILFAYFYIVFLRTRRKAVKNIQYRNFY